MQKLLTLCLLLVSAAASAQTTLRAHITDVGWGLEAGYRWDNKWGVRGGFLRGDLDEEFDAEDNNNFEGDELEYDTDIDLDNEYLFVDWHPWNQAFRLSAGAVYNRSDAKIVTRCEPDNGGLGLPGTNNCEFGNSLFAGDVIGEVTTKIDFEPIAPYLGIGWGHKTEAGFAVNADLGVIYVGDANVEMTSSGSCSQDAECRRQLEEEEDEVREELDKYRFLPYASLGVSYYF